MNHIEIQVLMRSASKGYFAYGVFDGKGLTVCKGSKVVKVILASAGNNMTALRSTYLDEEYRTTKDLYFKTPSAASTFVCGRSANGWVEWVTPDGVKLSNYRNIIATSNAGNMSSGKLIPDIVTEDEPIHIVHNTGTIAAAEAMKPVTRVSSEIHLDPVGAAVSVKIAEPATRVSPETQADLEVPSTVLPETTEKKKTGEANIEERQIPYSNTDHTMSNQRLRQVETKLDMLLRAATAFSKREESVDTGSDKTVPVSEDKRYHIAATNSDDLCIICYNYPNKILSLSFTLKMTIRCWGKSEHELEVFFLNSGFHKVSEKKTLTVHSDGVYSLPFVLRSSVSEEKNVFLAVRSSADCEDELRQLIRIPVDIAFSADFDF